MECTISQEFACTTIDGLALRQRDSGRIDIFVSIHGPMALLKPKVKRNQNIKSLIHKMINRATTASTFSSPASDVNMFSIFVLSFADVSITNRISGMHSHKASASLKSTSRSSSKSHLFPTKMSATFDVVYRRTSSIQRCMLRNEARFVMS